MVDTVRRSQEVLQDAKKKTGRGMIGYFHPVIPEELVYAAELHPVRLFPNFEDSITLGNAYLQTYLCSYLRADWDQVIKGKRSYLDGAIIPRSCEAVTFLYQTWRRHNPFRFIDYINVPWKRDHNTIGFFAEELGRIKKNLEGFTGKEISEDSLRRAIKIYNRNRELLHKVYSLRKAEAPPISGLEAIYVVMSSFLVDKAEHNGLLDQLLRELSQRPEQPDKEVRLLISGGCVIDVRLWEMMESLGAAIVADDVNNGSRSFWHTVVETTKGPLEALARGYAMVSCGFNTSVTERFDYVSKMITEYRVNGVIFAVNRNCESEEFVYPELDKRIKERFGIPTLTIETDYLMGLTPLRNRIEAFMGILRNQGF
ncbi:MAG: 2-hydroxyacyl-CoA dehydratase family protein [Desulfobacteraceae bacterium]